MKVYYDGRAPEYDDWDLRRGRWDGVEPGGGEVLHAGRWFVAVRS